MKVRWIEPFIIGFGPNPIEHRASTGRPHCCCSHTVVTDKLTFRKHRPRGPMLWKSGLCYMSPLNPWLWRLPWHLGNLDHFSKIILCDKNYLMETRQIIWRKPDKYIYLTSQTKKHETIAVRHPCIRGRVCNYGLFSFSLFLSMFLHDYLNI